MLRQAAPSPATGYALRAAAATAGYTVWDKRAINAVPAFTYLYSYPFLSAGAYAAFVLQRHGRAAPAQEWATRRWPIVQVGVLNTVAYLLE